MIQLIGLKSNLPLQIREKFSVIQKRCEVYTKKLYEICDEVIVLSTCNRTEIYFSSNCHDEDIIDNIFDVLGWDKNLREYTFYYKDNKVAVHLMNVICGFKSRILGEDQILGQIKDSYELATKVKTVNKDLQKLFQIAITCGKEFRTKSRLYEVPVSSSSIVVSKSKEKGIKRFMILGFGEVGKLTLKYILGTSFNVVYIAVRNPKSVHPFEDERIRVITFEDRFKHYNDVECIISCTSAPHCVVSKDKLPKDKSITIFDLAVPRDVEEDVYKMENVEVYDIDTVSSIDDENRKKRELIMEDNKYIVDKYIKEFLDWKKIQQISGEIINLKKCGERVYEKRYKTFRNKKATKDNERLAEVLLKSTSDAFINRAIDVLKEEQLKGRVDDCMRVIKKIFYAAR